MLLLDKLPITNEWDLGSLTCAIADCPLNGDDHQKDKT